jgi:hypothetical protein
MRQSEAPANLAARPKATHLSPSPRTSAIGARARSHRHLADRARGILPHAVGHDPLEPSDARRSQDRGAGHRWRSLGPHDRGHVRLELVDSPARTSG